MSEDPLEQLARLRAHSVDEARVALRAAEEARTACRRARDAALAAEASHERTLSEARARFVAADTVAALRWSARCAESELAGRARERLQVRRRERQLQQATTERELLAQALRTRELERRAVSRTLARRAEAVMRRTDSRIEDDADDSFRSVAWQR